MAGVCKICRHPQRAEIEAAIANGDPKHLVAKNFGLSTGGVQRHKLSCRVTALTKELARKAERIDILANLVLLADDAARAQQSAEREEKWGTVALLIGKRREVLDSIHEIQGPDEQSRDFTRDPRWIEAWNNVLGALSAYPEARAAVVRALSAAPRPRGDS